MKILVYIYLFIYFGKRVYVADFLLTKRKMHKKFYLRTLTEGCSLEDNLSDFLVGLVVRALYFPLQGPQVQALVRN